MGEYAQMEIDNNIGDWNGGFCSYKLQDEIITLKPEYAELLHEIMVKYHFVIKTEPSKHDCIKIKESSFCRNIIRFYKKNGFVTKKQFNVAVKNGQGYFINGDKQ